MKSSTITLPDSGIILTVNRQSPSVVKNIARSASDKLSSKKPIPPKQRLEVEEGRFEEIANISDEQYQLQLQEWNRAVNLEQTMMMLQIAFKIGIVRDEHFAVCIKKADELKVVYDSIGMQYDEQGDDFVIAYVIGTTTLDIHTLLFEIYGRSLPDESQVVLRREMFRSNVQQ